VLVVVTRQTTLIKKKEKEIKLSGKGQHVPHDWKNNRTSGKINTTVFQITHIVMTKPHGKTQANN